MTAVVHAAPKNPSTANLTSFESCYIKYYLDILLPHYVEEHHRPDNRCASEVLFHRFGQGFSSKSVRAAIILYAHTAHHIDSHDPSHVDEYRQKFYSLTRTAISKKAYAEVVYGSHIFCLHGFLAGLPFSEIAQHASGFILGVKELQREDGLPAEELFLLRCMCKDLFSWMISGFGVEGEKPGDREMELFQLAQLAQPIFEPDMDADDEPEWRKDAGMYLRVQMLLYRLQIGFDYFLVKRAQSKTEDDDCWFEPFACTLGTVLSDLVDIIQDSPEIRSMTDHYGIFGADSFEKASAEYPREEEETEWLLWQPSLMAHYKSTFRDVLAATADKSVHETISVEALAEGLSVCRLIDSDKPKKSRLSCLSALQSLIITFWMQLSHHNDSGSPHQIRNLTIRNGSHARDYPTTFQSRQIPFDASPRVAYSEASGRGYAGDDAAGGRPGVGDG